MASSRDWTTPWGIWWRREPRCCRWRSRRRDEGAAIARAHGRGRPEGWAAERIGDPARRGQDRADRPALGHGPLGGGGDELRLREMGSPDGRWRRGDGGH